MTGIPANVDESCAKVQSRNADSDWTNEGRRPLPHLIKHHAHTDTMQEYSMALVSLVMLQAVEGALMQSASLAMGAMRCCRTFWTGALLVLW